MWKTETKTLDRLLTGDFFFLIVSYGRPQDNAGNLSHPRAWIIHELRGAVTYTHVALSERRGLVVGCLYFEIEGQSWVLENANPGLIKNWRIGPLDK